MSLTRILPSPRRLVVALGVLAALLGSSGAASAQWAVWRVRYGDLSGNQDSRVARHGSEASARADSERRNEANNVLGIYFEVREETGVDRNLSAMVLANATVRVNEVLKQTRDVASYSGMKIPAAGQVLGGYSGEVAAAYDRAADLKKEMVEFAGKAPEEMFDKLNAALGAGFENEAGLTLERRIADVRKQAAEAVAQSEQPRQAELDDLVERITTTENPEERAKLVARLEEMQNSGELKTAVLGQSKVRETAARAEASKALVDSLRKSVAENRQRQQEIVTSIRNRVSPPRPTASTPAGSSPSASTPGGGDTIRRKNGYPISPDHLKIPNYNGPRWVNGRLVSP